MVTAKSGVDNLPPVVQLLLHESLPVSDADKYIRRLLPEVRRQAEWTLQNLGQVYPKTTGSHHGLTISPTSGLDFPHMANAPTSLVDW